MMTDGVSGTGEEGEGGGDSALRGYLHRTRVNNTVVVDGKKEVKHQIIITTSVD